MGRSAQDRLAELEKQQAPIASQIEQAALFVGLVWDERSSINIIHDTYAQSDQKTSFHGREDWALKWLLKKLGSQDGIGRNFAQSWRFLTFLLGRVPIPTAAKTLNERNLITLIRQALEEAVDRKCKKPRNVESDHDSSETARSSSVKNKVQVSRKRKRSGELVAEVKSEGDSLTDLLNAISESVQLVISYASGVLRDPAVVERAFASEYMKAAIRTTSEEAAKILGAWLTLCQDLEKLSISPFQKIWDLHVAGDDQSSQIMFSKYCLEPSLALISSGSQWKADLEKLIARNVLSPGKAHLGKESKISFASLARTSVGPNPKFAPILFEIAIRCLRPQASGRYSPQDSAWLQEVFSTLQDAIHVEDRTTRNIAVQAMLRVANEKHVIIDLPQLRTITTSYGFSDSGQIDIDIIAAVINLDANVFLVPDHTEDLMKMLLNQITLTSLDPGWPSVAHKMVDEILTPLIGNFAKARSLTRFIHHWFDQMVSFDTLRQKSAENILYFSAWEDNAMHAKLREVMEDSLNHQQILDIIDWLESKFGESENAVLVLTEALVGAINRYETAEALAARLSGLIGRSLASSQELIPGRYKPRKFHLIPLILEWKSVDYFKIFITKDEYRVFDQAEAAFENEPNSLEALEAFRCICAMAAIQPVDEEGKRITQVPLSHIITPIFQLLDNFVQQLKLGKGLGSDAIGTRIVSTTPGIGFLAPAFAKVVLMEYPEVLKSLAATSPEALDDFLRRMFWIASTALPEGSDTNSNLWLQENSNVFPNLWKRLLQNEDLQNDKQLMSHLITTMLKCSTHAENPIFKSEACNGFAVRSLLLLPVELFSKTNREIILKAWKPQHSQPPLENSLGLAFQMSNLDPAILSLKTKMISRSMSYEGINFQDFIHLAEAIALSPNPKILLAVFSALARTATVHASENIGQAKSDEFIHEGVIALKNWLHSTRKSKSPLGCGMICLAGVFTSSLNRNKTNAEINDLSTSVRDSLILNIRSLLAKPAKLKVKNFERCESLMSSLNVIESLETSPEALEVLEAITKSSTEALMDVNESIGQIILDFRVIHFSSSLDNPPDSLFDGNITSSFGRQDIRKKAMAAMKSMNNFQKVDYLARLLDQDIVQDSKLNVLLPLRDMIDSCEDTREAIERDTPSESLSSIYSKLAKSICNGQGVRQFCLLSQSMEFILSSKPRSITQYNVEETLSSICHICSPSGPSLRPSHARTIYAQLCALLITILTSHRVKLQGRSHLLIEALKAMLKPLFTPLSAPFASRFPPWQPSNPSQALSPGSASSFTRILTLLCDPTASAVRSHAHNALSSAPVAAKRLAGQYMPQVLAAYIKLTLDMGLAMDVEVREKLVPGWEAVLATMSVEGRRALGEQLDAGGRAVLAALVRDWVKFGKWKGD